MLPPQWEQACACRWCCRFQGSQLCQGNVIRALRHPRRLQLLRQALTATMHAPSSEAPRPCSWGKSSIGQHMCATAMICRFLLPCDALNPCPTKLTAGACARGTALPTAAAAAPPRPYPRAGSNRPNGSCEQRWMDALAPCKPDSKRFALAMRHAARCDFWLAGGCRHSAGVRP